MPSTLNHIYYLDVYWTVFSVLLLTQNTLITESKNLLIQHSKYTLHRSSCINAPMSNLGIKQTLNTWWKKNTFCFVCLSFDLWPDISTIFRYFWGLVLFRDLVETWDQPWPSVNLASSECESKPWKCLVLKAFVFGFKSSITNHHNFHEIRANTLTPLSLAGCFRLLSFTEPKTVADLMMIVEYSCGFYLYHD